MLILSLGVYYPLKSQPLCNSYFLNIFLFSDSVDESSEPPPPPAVARCLECDDYLCKKCLRVHRSVRALKGHPVSMLSELRSGNVTLTCGMPEIKMCRKHGEERLMFYCETCEVPICRQCAVIAHRHPEHQQKEIEGASAEQIDDIKELKKDCKKVAQWVDTAIEQNQNVQQDLEKAISNAKDELESYTMRLKEIFLERLEKNRSETSEELVQLGQMKLDLIKETEEELFSMRSQLATAREISSHVTKTGSQYEMASVYSVLSKTMRQLRELEAPATNRGLGRIKFKGNDQCVAETVKVGSILGRNPGDGCWVLENIIGEEGEHRLSFAVDVAMTPDEDIAVTDLDVNMIKVFTMQGELKYSFSTATESDEETSQSPWCVRIGQNGSYYVTFYKYPSGSPYVKIFNKKGSFQRQFHGVSPDDKLSSSDCSDLRGLAIDGKGHILVGNITKNYISRHRADGLHVSSINVSIQPWFLAVTSNDYFVVSAYNQQNEVLLIDSSGRSLQSIALPEGVMSWNSAGVVCGSSWDDDGEDEIFVSSRSDGHCVFCFSSKGTYLGRVAENLKGVFGLTLTADEERIVIADYHSVKVFRMV